MSNINENSNILIGPEGLSLPITEHIHATDGLLALGGLGGIVALRGFEGRFEAVEHFKENRLRFPAHQVTFDMGPDNVTKFGAWKGLAWTLRMTLMSSKRADGKLGVGWTCPRKRAIAKDQTSIHASRLRSILRVKN